MTNITVNLSNTTAKQLSEGVRIPEPNHRVVHPNHNRLHLRRT